jgi:energy-coupling factor transporter transmembrane protein EcfT
MMYHTGSFIKGQSLLYNLDPRVKLAAAVGLSIFILWVKPMMSFAIGIALLFIALTNGIRLRTLWLALKPLMFFIVLIFFVHIFFNESESDSAVKNYFSPSIEGLKQGFFVVWRFLSLIVAAIVLTMTTAPSQIIAALKYFLKPLRKIRVPVDDIAIMVTLALRLMPILLMEKERIYTAQKARGFDQGQSGLFIRLKSFLSLTSKVLAGVFRRADELSLAMEARHYHRDERSSFVELKFGHFDYLVVIFLVFSLIIFVALNSYFG